MRINNKEMFYLQARKAPYLSTQELNVIPGD